MFLGLCLGVFFLLFLWDTSKCADLPSGVHMECRDRFFMIAFDLLLSGEEPRFEAVDESGMFPITEPYAAKCGYSISLHLSQLRASYFSCHTQNKDDKEFTFNFNLIATRDGKEVTYALNKTCSPSLPWSPREVTCEENYMEVSMQSELTCRFGANMADWDTLTVAHRSTTSDWQVMFQKAGERLMPITIKEARRRGYVFDVTNRRLVFRTAYGQPDAFNTTVNDVPVEVIQASMFSRQSWVVLMVDLVLTCSRHEGSYGDGGYMIWETPETVNPGLNTQQISVGLSGELMEQPVAEDRGYIIRKHNNTVQISIPYNAEGRHRTSVVMGDLFEFFIFHLYLEQILVDEVEAETRLRLHRTLTTDLLRHPVVTDNRTVVEDRIFTVYLGDIPEDVNLVGLELNGQWFTAPFTNTSTCKMEEEVHPDTTHGFTLKVSFDDPCVIQQFSTEDAVVQYQLDVNYTLTIVPDDEPFYHVASFVAVWTDLTPPTFDAFCSETGIVFRLDRRSLDHKWEVVIGSDPLTSDLANQYSYIMSNDGDDLLLEAPLFTQGYEYKNMTLEGFNGTFEIHVRDRETSNIQSSTVKTCPFTAQELIVCSTDGMMTVVADLSSAIPSGGVPARTNLLDKNCGPREADDTRALFSFPVSSCGSVVKLDNENVMYENEIFYSEAAPDESTDRVIVQCTYPLSGLHRLFSTLIFESDSAGFGSITHTLQPEAGLNSPTITPTVLTTNRPIRTAGPYKPAHPSSVRYVKVHPGLRSFIQRHHMGADGSSEDDTETEQR